MQPTGKPANTITAAAWAQDLGLEDVVRAFSTDNRQTPFIRQMLTALSTDPGVIRWRQAVLHDFLQNPALVERVSALLPRLADLRMGHALLGKRQRGILLETTDRLAQLDLYLSVVEDLHEALSAATLQAEALHRLQNNLAEIIKDENFQALRAQLPELQRPLQNIRSLTIGVNLDSQLQPSAATLLSINDRPFTETRSFLSRLLGAHTSDENDAGLAPLHYTPSDLEQRPLSPLFQDLERLITQIAQPVARALGRYIRISSAPLTSLENELIFYSTAVSMIRRLEMRGVTFCQPEIAPVDERITRIEGLLNLNLAARDNAGVPISNDVQFDDQGRIGILTGPNSGGKTTYLQSVGLAHVLAQAGLLIPAHSARLSPVDAIFTHFPALETRQQGRLAEEAERLRDIFVRASQDSLVLLNESLSSTTPGEALYLAKDVLCGLRAVGVRGLFATHLIELAARIPEIEQAVSGTSSLMSLVAGVTQNEDGRALPTFRIARGEPLGSGYAREIARRHGISLEQILEIRSSNNGKRL